jgi:hydrogenase maturation protease
MSSAASQTEKSDKSPAGPLDVLVLGVGNILLSDEGAGVHVVNRFQERYSLAESIEVVDGGTSGMDLLPLIENRTHLFIVDVINASTGSPGQVQRIALTDPPAYFRQKVTPHQLGLNEVLALADMSGTMPGSIVLFGVIPKSMETGLDLSPEVEAGQERLLEMLVAELESMGLPPQARAAGA